MKDKESMTVSEPVAATLSKKLLKMISKQILLLKTMPEIGRQTDTSGPKQMSI